MKKEIKLLNGNKLVVQIDDRKSTNQAYIMELDENDKPRASTHFSTVKGYRVAENNNAFEEMSEYAMDALNELGEGKFIIS